MKSEPEFSASLTDRLVSESSKPLACIPRGSCIHTCSTKVLILRNVGSSNAELTTAHANKPQCLWTLRDSLRLPVTVGGQQSAGLRHPGWVGLLVSRHAAKLVPYCRFDSYPFRHTSALSSVYINRVTPKRLVFGNSSPVCRIG